MAERPQDFYLYRMLVIDDDGAFNFMGRSVQNDQDIIEILRQSADAELDVTVEGPVNQYKYHVREFVEYDAEGLSDGPIFGLTLARSVLQQQGAIVTDDAIITGTSTPDPPIATTTHLVFFMERHIVAVAYNSALMDSQNWRVSLHEIFDGAAHTLEFRSNIRIEPIPQESEVLETFRSFSLLTRLRVYLKLPNPELSRYTRNLYNEMQEGGIREFLQDMKNRDGLSQEQGKLPYAAAAMADDGYKLGDVTMEGERNGNQETVVTGQSAAHVSMTLEGIRQFARGQETLARSKDAKVIVSTLLGEINRSLPKPDNTLATVTPTNPGMPGTSRSDT